MTEFDFQVLLSEGLEPSPAGARLRWQRARLLESIKQEHQGRTRWQGSTRGLPAKLAFGLTLGLAIGGVYFATSPESALPHELTASLDATPLAEGGWIETGARSEKIEFSEGSQVKLLEGSKARIGRLGPEHAELMLESGRLDAHIIKHTGIHWTIAAGPYRVHVVGTQFSVEWDFTRERFRVAVEEGEVRVSGGNDLPAAGTSLRAGQSLLRSGRSERPTALPEPGEVPPIRPFAARPDPAPPQVTGTLRARSRESGSPAVPHWRELARRGRYTEALASARKLGLSKLSASLGADDMLLLANSARYAGDTRTARATFLELRQRHAGQPAARLAAFSLGRLASDADHDPGQAARWFRTFLSESPRGDLAAGARARLMNNLLKLGDEAGAQAVARDYLRYHPDGPQSDTARSLVNAAQSR